MDNDSLQWNDVDEIAVRLWEQNEELNPLSVSFPALIEMILALPGFVGERDKCGEKILEAIQMGWLEEFEAD
ncbi:MAG: Fe-S assembly protein IscX [Planctomycetota bacterium]|jgi:FeS assembly protein IscX|nr:MAG: Fe-S assembly protein IscX [Planctomycetota bacterium]